MPDKEWVTLNQMRTGQQGKIIQVEGGLRLINRLDSLGIRKGKKITKISSMLMRGPVTIQTGRTHVAIGHGMAHKILVELE